MTYEGKHFPREEQARRLAESLKRQLGEFCGFLAEHGLVELMLSADGTVRADRLGEGMTPVGRMPLGIRQIAPACFSAASASPRW